MAFIYHERQLGGLCGVHCLNNLLQGPQFGPGDLAEIGVQLDAQERALLEEGGGQGGTAAGSSGDGGAGSGAQGAGGSSSSANDPGAGRSGDGGGLEGECYNVDPSADGGNFSIQVLTLALARFGLELLPAKHPDAREPMKDPGKAAEAFLCQYRDHWFAIRQVADCWWNLNSTRKKPAMVGPFYLAAWLAQLSAEGYSIYLVLGEKMPELVQPHDPNHPEENFHQLFDLLEEAKQSGGNPLAGGEPDDSDAAAARALEAEWAAQDAARFDGGFGGGFGGGGGGGGGSLYEEMLRAQAQGQDSQWLSADGGGGSSRPGRPAMSRGVNGSGGQALAQGSGWWSQLTASISQCTCSPVSDQTEEIIDDNQGRSVPSSPSSQSRSRQPQSSTSRGSAMGGIADEGGATLIGDAALAAARFGGGAEIGGDAPGPQALKEMGFAAPVVHIAQALAEAPHSPSALQLLVSAETAIEPAVEADGERLGRAIQAAVLACDTTDCVTFGQRLIAVAALLGAAPERLRAAQPHLSSPTLAEFLRSILRSGAATSWPTATRSACEVGAKELLSAFPP